MKLIICGNGFDMHHNLKTGYSEYKKYLQCNVPLLVEKFEKFPWFPGKCKNDLWRDVENTLALNLQEMIEHFKAYYSECLIPLYGTKKWTAYFHTDADYEEKTAFFAKNAITTHQCKKW